MKLTDLCSNFAYQCIQGDMDREIEDVTYDSRKVQKHSLFVCIKGALCDGHNYISDAVKKGADAIVLEHICGQALPPRYHSNSNAIHTPRIGVDFTEFFRTPIREVDDDRYYRNKGENNHFVYDKRHFGRGGGKSWPDWDTWGDDWYFGSSDPKHNAGVLRDTAAFAFNGGFRMQVCSYGSILSGFEATQGGRSLF